MVLPGYNYSKRDLFGLLDDVSCDGTEVSFIDCPSRQVGVYHCTCGEIVSVACYNGELSIYTVCMGSNKSFTGVNICRLPRVGSCTWLRFP